MLELDSAYETVRVAGTDEAGRGPLCGPVCAAAVILPAGLEVAALNDSKTLSERQRDALFDIIQADAVAWSIAWCSAAEIDQLNILQASHLAMVRAIEGLAVEPEHVLVDGNRIPKSLTLPATALVKGDGRHSAIAAASILAKVARDRHMAELDERFPGYELSRNKGYPTKTHMAALTSQGACPEHRKSFAPVRRALGITNGRDDTDKTVPQPIPTQGSLEF